MRLNVRWVRPANIHLTLTFLGDIKPAEIGSIDEALADVAGGFAPFVLTLRGLGFFPGAKRPRVMWVGLGGDTRRLFDVQAGLTDRLAEIGFPKEKRPYKAHLTLGRIRQSQPSGRFHRAQQQYADWGDQKFTAERIVLFRSDLKPSGAVYSPLKQRKLGKVNILD